MVFGMFTREFNPRQRSPGPFRSVVAPGSAILSMMGTSKEESALPSTASEVLVKVGSCEKFSNLEAIVCYTWSIVLV